MAQLTFIQGYMLRAPQWLAALHAREIEMCGGNRAAIRSGGTHEEPIIYG